MKTYSWIENLLSSLSKKTGALIDKAEKFLTWQKKNSMINQAVKVADDEISQNQNTYRYYMGKADSVGLGINYIRKIQNGTLSEEELSDEELSEKIEQYQEWYDKAQDVQNTIQELYEQQRSLIRQKLDNILTYYDDMDSYLSSITSKIESLISLHDEMGRRSSFTELVEHFASHQNSGKAKSPRPPCFTGFAYHTPAFLIMIDATENNKYERSVTKCPIIIKNQKTPYTALKNSPRFLKSRCHRQHKALIDGCLQVPA